MQGQSNVANQSFLLTINNNWAEYTASDLLRAFNAAYARQAHRLGVQLPTPYIDWSESSDDAPPNVSRASVTTQPSSSMTIPSYPVTVGGPSGSRMRDQRRQDIRTNAPLTTQESVWALGVQGPGSPTRLILMMAFGAPLPGHRQSFLRLALDLGSDGLWTLHPEYEVRPKNWDYRASGAHRVNPCAGRYNPRREQSFDMGYIDGSTYRYIQINSPVIIEAQMSTQSRDIFLSDIRSQAAVRISQGLDEERDVDGFVGLEPQAVDFKSRMSHEDRRGARPTLMNELCRINKTTRQRKSFALSPCYRRTMWPRMWILDNDIWPPTASSTSDPREYRLNRGESTPPIPVRPSSRGAPGWTVKLSGICLWDVVAQKFVCREKLDDFVTVDNGCETTLLPPKAFTWITAPKHPAKVYHPRKRFWPGKNKKKFCVQPRSIDPRYHLAMAFRANDGADYWVTIAPLSEIVTYREAADNGHHMLAFAPQAQGLRPIIGLNVLRYLWQSYHDTLPAAAYVHFAYGYCGRDHGRDVY